MGTEEWREGEAGRQAGSEGGHGRRASARPGVGVGGHVTGRVAVPLGGRVAGGCSAGRAGGGRLFRWAGGWRVAVPLGGRVAGGQAPFRRARRDFCKEPLPLRQALAEDHVDCHGQEAQQRRGNAVVARWGAVRHCEHTKDGRHDHGAAACMRTVVGATVGPKDGFAGLWVRARLE